MTKKLLFLLLFIGLIASVVPVEAAELEPIVKDKFNKYTKGSLVGQGGWESYVNGSNFIVQNNITFEGKKAIYNNSLADSVINKLGVPRANGRQAVYVRTKNRSNWGSY